MTQNEFNVVLEQQYRKCADVLVHKKKEYTGDRIDRLSAFKIAASLQGCTPKTALAGMMSKHVVSLYDMCYSSLLQFEFRPHENDAGADVYMPYDCTLKPGEIARIPLGFGLMIPDGYAGYVFPRSSMAAKGLVCELPPIDSGYRGEIHAIISNVSSESQILSKDTRVGQLVITPVLIADFVLDLGEARDIGAFGSTGE